MPRLLTLPQATIPVGEFASANLSLPIGTRRITVAYSTPGWPGVSDGQATLRFMIARSGGPFVREWSDTFQHVQLMRGGAPYSPQIAKITLPSAFGGNDQLRVELSTTVPFTSALTVDADQ